MFLCPVCDIDIYYPEKFLAVAGYYACGSCAVGLQGLSKRVAGAPMGLSQKWFSEVKDCNLDGEVEGGDPPLTYAILSAAKDL